MLLLINNRGGHPFLVRPQNISRHLSLGGRHTEEESSYRPTTTTATTSTTFNTVLIAGINRDQKMWLSVGGGGGWSEKAFAGIL